MEWRRLSTIRCHNYTGCIKEGYFYFSQPCSKINLRDAYQPGQKLLVGQSYFTTLRVDVASYPAVIFDSCIY